MQFNPTRIDGAWLIQPEPAVDQRGFFIRTFCMREFGALGLETAFVQHCTSGTSRRGSLRGLHYQAAPHTEVKLVTCLRGAVLDVIVDLRPASPSYLQWQQFELSAENRHQLYIPKGCAHGFQTLTDEVEVGYLISAYYAPDHALGLRYDDPALGIPWPLPVTVISDRDLAWPLLPKVPAPV